MTKLKTRGCCECGLEYDILIHTGEEVTLEGDGADCPACGSAEFVGLTKVPLGIELGDEGSQGRTYPYYDRNLQMRISNKNHRKEVCKRRGIVPAECSIDTSSQANADRTEKDRRKKRYADLRERYDKDSAFADYRRGRDKGAYKSKLKAASE